MNRRSPSLRRLSESRSKAADVPRQAEVRNVVARREEIPKEGYVNINIKAA
jgi:hypothetical protein